MAKQDAIGNLSREDLERLCRHETAWADIALASIKEEEGKVKKLRDILGELIASAEYWSEYDVPIGIVDRMRKAYYETADTPCETCAESIDGKPGNGACVQCIDESEYHMV